MAAGASRARTVLSIQKAHETFHIHDGDVANRILGLSPHEDCLRSAINCGSVGVLGSVVKAFPSLYGKAQYSLSTALRVRDVRDALAADQELHSGLLHVAAGADAFRHLTPQLIDKLVARAHSLFGSLAECGIHDSEGGIQVREGGIQVPEGRSEEGGAVLSEGGFHVPEGGIQVPQGGTQVLEVPGIQIEGGAVLSEGGIHVPEGGIQVPQGGIQVPKGGIHDCPLIGSRFFRSRHGRPLWADLVEPASSDEADDITEQTVDVPCGNTVALSGVGQYIFKSGITTIGTPHNITPMKYSVSPIVKGPVKIKDGKESSEHVFAGCSELHVETCLEDMREKYAQCDSMLVSGRIAEQVADVPCGNTLALVTAFETARNITPIKYNVFSDIKIPGKIKDGKDSTMSISSANVGGQGGIQLAPVVLTGCVELHADRTTEQVDINIKEFWDAIQRIDDDCKKFGNISL